MTDASTSPRWKLSEKTRTRILTDAERIICYGVRAHRAPNGPYFVDFVAHTANRIVEIDGGKHFENEEETTRFLERKGYRVLRLSHLEVMSNRNGVREKIAAAARGAGPNSEQGS